MAPGTNRYITTPAVEGSVSTTVARVSESIPIHNRTYETQAFAEPDGSMRVVGRLVDTKPHGLALADGEPLVIHDMTVELVVDGDTFEILKVRPIMNVHPYKQCTGILDSYQQLVGTSISRGYSKRIKELFGGPGGCSHIGALLIAMGPIVVQASWGRVKMHEDLDELATRDQLDQPELERQMRLNENTCHVWKSEGTQVALLRKGERPVSPDWEIERLAKLGVIE